MNSILIVILAFLILFILRNIINNHMGINDLIDDNEVTLKRIRRKGESIALEPENLNHETRIFGPGRVKVQGRIAGIIRKYDC